MYLTNPAGHIQVPWTWSGKFPNSAAFPNLPYPLEYIHSLFSVTSDPQQLQPWTTAYLGWDSREPAGQTLHYGLWIPHQWLINSYNTSLPKMTATLPKKPLSPYKLHSSQRQILQHSSLLPAHYLQRTVKLHCIEPAQFQWLNLRSLRQEADSPHSAHPMQSTRQLCQRLLNTYNEAALMKLHQRLQIRMLNSISIPLPLDNSDQEESPTTSDLLHSGRVTDEFIQ